MSKLEEMMKSLDNPMVQHFTKQTINHQADLCHTIAMSKDWWSQPTDTIPTKLLMIMTEIAEATEELRNPSGEVNWNAFQVELMDILIRTFDMACYVYDKYKTATPGDIYLDKMQVNRSRPVRHGGKNI